MHQHKFFKLERNCISSTRWYKYDFELSIQQCEAVNGVFFESDELENARLSIRPKFEGNTFEIKKKAWHIN